MTCVGVLNSWVHLNRGDDCPCIWVKERKKWEMEDGKGEGQWNVDFIFRIDLILNAQNHIPLPIIKRRFN